jgi:hypothetical protein
MLIQGVEVSPEHIEWLRLNVAEPTAATIREAMDKGWVWLRVEPEDEDRIMAALIDKAPAELEELRDKLRREREHRSV